MRSLLINYFWRPPTLTGLAVHIDASGSLTIHACKLRVFNNKLDILDKHVGLKNVLHFSKQYPGGPLALCITGKGVMTRQVDKLEALEAQTLQQILPNANPEEFYVQSHQDDTGAYLSLIRRKEADQLIASLEEHGFRVLSLNLGGFAAKEVLKPANTAVEEALQHAYDVAFQTLLLPDGLEVQSTIFSQAKQQAFARVKLMRLVRLFGIAAGIMLLLNFILYQYYTEKVSKLATKSKGTAVAVSQLKALETSLSQKTGYIQSVGWTAGLNPAFIIDRLLSLLPAQVTVQEFSLNPRNKEAKRLDQAFVYRMGLVEVSGMSVDAGTLNNWLLAIKSYHWVKDCQIKNYLVSPESGQGLFTIHIQLEGDEE